MTDRINLTNKDYQRLGREGMVIVDGVTITVPQPESFQLPPHWKDRLKEDKHDGE